MIQIEDLVKRDRNAKRNTVDGISFDVGAGEFFALLGPYPYTPTYRLIPPAAVGRSSRPASCSICREIFDPTYFRGAAAIAWAISVSQRTTAW
jgi:hypothetical protein